MLEGLPIVASMSLGAGPLMFAHSFRHLRVRRLIENTPTARIRSMAMGLVEFSGTVVGRSTVNAPFSGRSCVYWQVDISTPRYKRQWSVVHRNASGSPFYVEDETGVALVYPTGADCKVRFGREEQCLGITLPECYATYMGERHLALRHLWRLGPMRFRERTLDEGQRVYVLGTAMPRSLSRRITQDDPEAPAPVAGTPEARRRELDAKSATVVRRGEGEPTFIISQESERELLMGLGARVFGGLVAGPALTLLGLGYWLNVLASRGIDR
jgi:E3 Ubiquitin ligase